MQNSSIIEVKNVSRSFTSSVKGTGLKESFRLLWNPQMKTTQALNDVSFSLESGSFTGLIGANGAGKTTLLKILSGLLAPTSGTARVMGFDPFLRDVSFRKNISLVMGQKAQLWWDLPALDAFDLLRAIYDIPKPLFTERLYTLAKLLDVERHLSTQIRRLSLGERMKMELIGAILHWPKLIYLDEPTIGLDVVSAQKLREFLKEHNRKEKATIILTSHNMDDIERLCSRVLIMKNGSLIFDGKPGGLTKKGECRLRLTLVQSPSASEISKATGIPENTIEILEVSGDEEHEQSKQVYIATKYDAIVECLQKMMKEYQILTMGVEEQSLENVITRLFSGEKV